MDEHRENAEPLEHADRPPELRAAIAEARSVSREQVLAAWQIHLDHVREQLEAGWRDTIDKIFDERFSEVETRLAEGFERAVTSRCNAIAEQNASYVRSTARRDVIDWLNQTGRRLRQSETRDVWIHSILDAAAEFCGTAAFFLVTSKGLKMEGARGARTSGAADVDIPLASAPAFAGAIESKETVVAMGTAGELSQTIASLLGDGSERRVYLFPVVVRQNAVAVLYAEPAADSIDVNGLELLVSLASSSIETTETVTVRTPAGDLVRDIGRAPAAEAPKPAAKPSWAELSKSEQELHLRAQRFARTQVAQLLLHRVNQVRTGRASHSLYRTLRGEIDAGREAFRQQFFENCPSMVDYYHLEIVRTLAQDTVDVLGPDYPGPVVR